MRVGILAALVAEGEEREHRRADDLEVRFGGKPPGEFLRPFHMVADHRAQALEAVVAHQEPEFQRAEAPAERHGPFGIVDDAVMAVSLQVFRLDGEGAHLVLGAFDELHRAVEIRPQPFVRVEDDGIGRLDAIPERAEFRADHRRTGPCRVHMQVKPMRLRDFGDRADRVAGADGGAAGAGDDAGRDMAGRKVRLDRGVERLRVHAVERPLRRDAHEVRLADARYPDRPVDGGVDLFRGIDAHGLVRGQPLAVALPGKRLFAHHQHGGERRGGGRILDDAGKAVRQAERPAQPVDGAGFQFRRRRRGLPEHALGGDGGDEVVRDH